MYKNVKILKKKKSIIKSCSSWLNQLSLLFQCRQFFDVTRTTQQRALVRITTFVLLICQLHAAILTNVTIDVKVFVHTYNAYSLFCAFNGSDSCTKRKINFYLKKNFFWELLTFSTSCTFRGINLMIIINTVNFIVNIHCKWNSVKTFVAHAASEATRMIRFAHCL